MTHAGVEAGRSGKNATGRINMTLEETRSGRELPIVGRVQERVREITKGVPDHHGFTHLVRSTTYGKFIALSEGADPIRVQIAGLIHDLRCWDDSERKARKITYQGSEIKTQASSTDILEELRRDGLITDEDFSDIEDAVKRHGMENPPVQDTPTVSCLRDADRLSRSGTEGLLSILEANQNYGVPFYIPEGEIFRPDNAPVMPYEDIKSCIDDINACLDWEKMMHTQTGLTLAQQMNRINRAFLSVFSRFPNYEYDVWIPWLRNIITQQKEKKALLKTVLQSEKLDGFRNGLIEVEDPALLSLENFVEFRASQETL